MQLLKVPYVRHGTPTTRQHHEREKWGGSIQLFMSMKYMSLVSLVRLLWQDRFLPDWSKKPCPHCGHGALTKLAFIKSRKMSAHRCRVKACQRFVQPADFPPIFVSGAGKRKTSLQKQASILLCAVASVPQHCISKILDVDGKTVSRVYTNVDMARAFVMAHEKIFSMIEGLIGWMLKPTRWIWVKQLWTTTLQRPGLPAPAQSERRTGNRSLKSFWQADIRRKQTHRDPHRRCPCLQAQTR